MNCPIRFIALVTSLALGPGITAAANEIAKSQQKWVPEYEKQENVPAPGDMLINTDPEPDLKDGFANLYNGDDTYLKGFFALQIHAGNDGTVHFRNIKVKELD